MLNKKQVVDKLAEKLNVSRSESLKITEAVLEVFEDACVNDGGIQIVGVCTIEKKLRKGRTCKNPQTGENIQTEDSYALSIKTGKSMKDKLNG